MNDSAPSGLLAALVAVLFVVGVAGAAIHKDKQPTTHLASPTTSSTPSTAASLTTTSAAPATTAAAPTTTTALPSTGSGLAATGAGRVVAGRSAMPNTGPPPLALPGGALLVLALASRRTSRRARA